MPGKNFNKPPLTINQQLNLLASRGLQIANKAQAQHWLEHVGYYRLSGYWRSFYKNQQATTHLFQPQAKFELVTALYDFDRQLRILTLDGVERIEVSIRASISNVLTELYGSHWFLDITNFKSNFNYVDLINKIKQETNYEEYGANNPIFKAYYEKYQQPNFPPSWMLSEGLSFGTWSRIYAFLARDKDKKAIAARFSLSWIVFQSWLQCICFVRNLSAHHAILGFRQFHIQPLTPKTWQQAERKHFCASHSLYAQMVVIHYLLKVIAPGNDWACRLKQLLGRYPQIPALQLGFPPHWDQMPFWGERALKGQKARMVELSI